jgi:hypothetical protein
MVSGQCNAPTYEMVYHSLNFPKPDKLPHKAILKNYNKSQKNQKIENLIVLDSK